MLDSVSLTYKSIVKKKKKITILLKNVYSGIQNTIYLCKNVIYKLIYLCNLLKKCTFNITAFP